MKPSSPRCLAETAVLEKLAIQEQAGPAFPAPAAPGQGKELTHEMHETQNSLKADLKAKVVYLPLDERPCNYDYPQLLARGSELELVSPPLKWMGDKKAPGSIQELGDWLEREAEDAEALIVSIDTLLYGGIVPSRLHEIDEQEAVLPLERLRRIRQRNPGITLYAFHLIMRCPRYSSSDEEPDYYAEWGRELFLLGYLGHRERLGLASAEESAELRDIEMRLPEPVRGDYLRRRAVNAAANQAVLELAADGTIDFLALPQDDAAPYGWTALDQQAVRERIRELRVGRRALMYPGADEAGCTLLARLVNRRSGMQPLVYLRYGSTLGPTITPLYEDRLLGESLKLHLLAAGGLLAESASDADLILLVNSPGERMGEAGTQQQPNLGYDVQRSVEELVEYGLHGLERLSKPVAVADVAYANGGDLQLLRLLADSGMLPRLAGVAGWNTSGNTIGTALCQLMLFARYGPTESHLDFLALRIAEDYGYCSAVRRRLADGRIKAMGMDYFSVDGQRGQAAQLVWRELESFAQRELAGSGLGLEIKDCRLPWSRMFEVGLQVTARLGGAGAAQAAAAAADNNEGKERTT